MTAIFIGHSSANNKVSEDMKHLVRSPRVQHSPILCSPLPAMVGIVEHQMKHVVAFLAEHRLIVAFR